MKVGNVVIAALAAAFVATETPAAEPSTSTKTLALPTTSAASPGQQAPASATSPQTKPGRAAAASSAAPTPASPHGATPPTQGTKSAKKAPAKPVNKVDLNNASLAELQTLPTVGEAEAKKIVANRPYASKTELVTKAGLPEGVYYAVRYKVSLQEPRKAAPKKE